MAPIPAQCPVCYKHLYSKQYLNIHMRTHTGEKPFTCEVCSQSFSQTVHLKKHVRVVHKGEKPFTCLVCQEKFSTKENLNRHMRVHTVEKPYSCNFCQKRFARQLHLKGHLRVHTGEKPYLCEVCSKNFSQLNNLKRHFNRVHKNGQACKRDFKKVNSTGKCQVPSTEDSEVCPNRKSYTCEVCFTKFSGKKRIEMHMKRHSPQEVNLTLHRLAKNGSVPVGK